MIRFLDLSVNDVDERMDLMAAFESHLDSGQFIINDQNNKFEQEFARAIARNHCVGFGTGTDALIAAIRLLNLPKDSQVITSCFSWIASATSIKLAGCHPLYVDIDKSLQICLVQLEKLLKSHSSRVLLVPHLHGNVSTLSDLRFLQSKYGLQIIEDCAQSYMARDINDELSGSLGVISAFSFNAMKTLGALGDAGAIVFDDPNLIERAKCLRHSGMKGSSGRSFELTTNSRLDELQSSFLRVKMRYFDAKKAKKREIASIYLKKLSNYISPVVTSPENSNYYCFQALCPSRDSLMEYLEGKGIETKIRHDFLIPDNPAMSYRGPDFPRSREFLSQILCIPLHHNMSVKEAHFVADNIINFYNR